MSPEAPRCKGTRRAGKACEHAAGPSGFCWLHDPEAARERGRAGGHAKAAHVRRARAESIGTVALEKAADIRAAIERGMAEVEAAPMDAEARSRAVARLCTVALSILRTVDLEAEVAALRALVMERFPETREQLGRDGA